MWTVKENIHDCNDNANDGDDGDDGDDNLNEGLPPRRPFPVVNSLHQVENCRTTLSSTKESSIAVRHFDFSHFHNCFVERLFFSTFLSLIHLWSRSRFSLISSESRKCQQSRKIVQWKPWKPNIDCWKRGYIAWFELTKMALWPYSQMHAFPKVDVFSKKSNLYLWTNQREKI